MIQSKFTRDLQLYAITTPNNSTTAPLGRADHSQNSMFALNFHRRQKAAPLRSLVALLWLAGLALSTAQAQSSAQVSSPITGLPLKVLNLADANVADAIMTTVKNKSITTVCIGKPHFTLFQVVLRTNVFNRLLNALSVNNVDLIILS